MATFDTSETVLIPLFFNKLLYSSIALAQSVFNKSRGEEIAEDFVCVVVGGGDIYY